MILDQIVEDKKKRLPEHKARISEQEMRRLAEETETRAANCFYENLKKPGLSIIGEFKKASPSLGKITSKIDLMERIEEYNASVDAISCLTEEDHFNGNVDYLKQIRAKSPLPILRKDFMIEEYQFYEAKAIGADAVLLITAILDDVQMHDFYQLARSLSRISPSLWRPQSGCAAMCRRIRFLWRRAASWGMRMCSSCMNVMWMPF
jgi:indole-3-glycerol phosphate synthase